MLKLLEITRKDPELTKQQRVKKLDCYDSKNKIY